MMKAILFLALVIVVCLAVSSCRPYTDEKSLLDQNRVAAQLQSVSGEIATSLLESNVLCKTSDIRLVVSDMARTKKHDYFRSEVFTNLWICISPDPERWNFTSRYSNEIAIYVPQKIRIAGLKDYAFVGTTFSGNETQFVQRPLWEPLPVWRLATNTESRRVIDPR